MTNKKQLSMKNGSTITFKGGDGDKLKGQLSNNEVFKQYQDKARLNNSQMGELLGVSERTIMSYVAAPSSTNYRTVQKPIMLLLKCLLGDK